jgi:hypothetical protein
MSPMMRPPHHRAGYVEAGVPLIAICTSFMGDNNNGEEAEKGGEA